MSSTCTCWPNSSRMARHLMDAVELRITWSTWPMYCPNLTGFAGTPPRSFQTGAVAWGVPQALEPILKTTTSSCFSSRDGAIDSCRCTITSPHLSLHDTTVHPCVALYFFTQPTSKPCGGEIFSSIRERFVMAARLASPLSSCHSQSPSCSASFQSQSPPRGRRGPASAPCQSFACHPSAGCAVLAFDFPFATWAHDFGASEEPQAESAAHQLAPASWPFPFPRPPLPRPYWASLQPCAPPQPPRAWLGASLALQELPAALPAFFPPPSSLEARSAARAVPAFQHGAETWSFPFEFLCTSKAMTSPAASLHCCMTLVCTKISWPCSAFSTALSTQPHPLLVVLVIWPMCSANFISQFGGTHPQSFQSGSEAWGCPRLLTWSAKATTSFTARQSGCATDMCTYTSWS
mmetsp:Transcript_48862/g.138095  ORF Transcript_48862/g.138095 Transcript_48862/m.138095 type:complete len:406 (+) Transcript_48862:231-1448(+)